MRRFALIFGVIFMLGAFAPVALANYKAGGGAISVSWNGGTSITVTNHTTGVSQTVTGTQEGGHLVPPSSCGGCYAGTGLDAGNIVGKNGVINNSGYAGGNYAEYVNQTSGGGGSPPEYLTNGNPNPAYIQSQVNGVNNSLNSMWNTAGNDVGQFFNFTGCLVTAPANVGLMGCVKKAEAYNGGMLGGLASLFDQAIIAAAGPVIGLFFNVLGGIILQQLDGFVNPWVSVLGTVFNPSPLLGPQGATVARYWADMLVVALLVSIWVIGKMIIDAMSVKGSAEDEETKEKLGSSHKRVVAFATCLGLALVSLYLLALADAFFRGLFLGQWWSATGGTFGLMPILQAGHLIQGGAQANAGSLYMGLAGKSSAQSPSDLVQTMIGGGTVNTTITGFGGALGTLWALLEAWLLSVTVAGINVCFIGLAVFSPLMLVIAGVDGEFKRLYSLLDLFWQFYKAKLIIAAGAIVSASATTLFEAIGNSASAVNAMAFLANVFIYFAVMYMVATGLGCRIAHIAVSPETLGMDKETVKRRGAVLGDVATLAGGLVTGGVGGWAAKAMQSGGFVGRVAGGVHRVMNGYQERKAKYEEFGDKYPVFRTVMGSLRRGKIREAGEAAYASGRQRAQSTVESMVDGVRNATIRRAGATDINLGVAQVETRKSVLRREAHARVEAQRDKQRAEIGKVAAQLQSWHQQRAEAAKAEDRQAVESIDAAIAPKATELRTKIAQYAARGGMVSNPATKTPEAMRIDPNATDQQYLGYARRLAAAPMPERKYDSVGGAPPVWSFGSKYVMLRQYVSRTTDQNGKIVEEIKQECVTIPTPPANYRFMGRWTGETTDKFGVDPAGGGGK